MTSLLGNMNILSKVWLLDLCYKFLERKSKGKKKTFQILKLSHRS